MGKAFILFERRYPVCGENMKTGRRNRQSMYYSLRMAQVPVYEKDRNGNTRYDEDGEPMETGNYEDVFKLPVLFKGNIRGTGGAATEEPYGMSTKEYDAILYAIKGELPLNEGDLIWYQNEPQYKPNGEVDDKSANYIVKRVPPSLNEIVYLLESIK